MLCPIKKGKKKGTAYVKKGKKRGQATFSVRKRIVSGVRPCHREKILSRNLIPIAFPKIRPNLSNKKSSLSPFFAPFSLLTSIFPMI